ncbi:MAG: AI-2E family transporter [Rubellimicrobium sp.]|nr:AI-2E family transporter [Rubellimicrobium sp.]
MSTRTPRPSLRQEIVFWTVAALVLIAALWRLGDILLPFVLGAALAYVLDPLAGRLARLGMGRVAAVTLIAVVTVLLLVLATVALVPLLLAQARGIVEAAPGIAQKVQSWLTTQFPDALDADSAVRAQIEKIGESIRAQGGALLQATFSSAMGLLNTLMLLLVAPVVAFYLLLDWPLMVARIDALLPRDHAPAIRATLRQIDRTLASFMRGQALVCLILGIYYAGALMLAGLEFGLVIGAVTGLVSFIPYVGAGLGGVLAIGFALVQFWGDWTAIGIVVAIFAFGQFVEGNVLSPRLVGGSVGLHPVWLILALSVMGGLFGFVGMLVAVPVSAVIGVLARIAVERYRAGPVYLGAQGPQQPSPHRDVPDDPATDL